MKTVFQTIDGEIFESSSCARSHAEGMVRESLQHVMGSIYSHYTDNQIIEISQVLCENLDRAEILLNWIREYNLADKHIQ